jgi:hypothetical protein
MKRRANRLCILLFGIITLQACQSRVVLNRDKRHIDAQSDMEVQSLEDFVHKGILMTTTRFTDSSHLDYQVTIFPVDTIRFSMDKGFTGKASGILVSRTSGQLINRKDSTFLSDGKSYQNNIKAVSSGKLQVRENRKIKEKQKPGNWFLLFSFLLVSITGLLVYFRFFNNKT